MSDDCAAWGSTRKIGYSKVRKPSTNTGTDEPRDNVSKNTAASTSRTKDQNLRYPYYFHVTRNIRLTELLRVNERPLKRKREEHSGDNGDEDEEPRAKSSKRPKKANTRNRQDTRGHRAQTSSNEAHVTPEDSRSGSSPRPFDFKYTGIRGTGPEYIDSDVDWMRRWMLLSSRLFYTYPHHDAAGLVTWTTLLNGMKLWSYVVPKNPESEPEAASRQYIELIKAMNHISIDTENRLPELAVSHNFFLSPGTLL